MPLELFTIPCLADNYAYVLHNAATGKTALVDAPEVEPIASFLGHRGFELDDILVTHHHHDHIDGVDALRVKSNARVIGAEIDAHRLPALDLAVSDGDTFEVCGETCHVIFVPGHSSGHIAFHLPESGYLFSADSLMAFGCGRLFEGTPAQMWNSLKRLRALPPETVVCSGHEYTATNAKFALTIEPDHPAVKARADAVFAARERGEHTVPSILGDEVATNPYLRADDEALKSAIGMPLATDEEIFAEVRKRKDNF